MSSLILWRPERCPAASRRPTAPRNIMIWKEKSRWTRPVAAPTKLNGLDVQAALDTIAAVKADKALARFQFRVRNRWVDGAENRSTIQGFYGAGREDTSRSKAFEYVHDEPPVLLGHNAGANPGESLLHALAGCITTTIVLHAMARGIVVRRLSTEILGDVDVRGVLGLDELVNPGFEQIRVRLRSKPIARTRSWRS